MKKYTFFFSLLIFPVFVSAQSCPAETNLADHMVDQLLTRIDGVAASDATKNLLSAVDNTGTGSYTRNTSHWGTRTDLVGYDPLDFTGISVWNNAESAAGNRRRAGTLITPQHIVFAKHFVIGNGKQVRFVDANNNVIERTLVESARVVGNTDMQIGVLDSPVPNTIKHYPLLPYEEMSAKIDKHAPVIATDQQNKAFIDPGLSAYGRADDSGVSPEARRLVSNIYTVETSPFDPFSEPVISGDSGSPNLVVIQGEMVLVSTHTGPATGPWYGAHMEALQQKIVELGNGGEIYSPTLFDLACFTDLNDSYSVEPFEATLDEDYRGILGNLQVNSAGTKALSIQKKTRSVSIDPDSFEVATQGESLHTEEYIFNATSEPKIEEVFSVQDDSFIPLLRELPFVLNITPSADKIPRFSDTIVVEIDENTFNGSVFDWNIESFLDPDTLDEGQSHTITMENRIQLFDYSFNRPIRTQTDFTLDPTTGEVTVHSNELLDFDAWIGMYLFVTVQDDGPFARKSTGKIGLRLINGPNNEHPPGMVLQSFDFERGIHGAPLEVGQIVATDADSGQELAYKIIAGNEQGYFDISSTGLISVASGKKIPKGGRDYRVNVEVQDDHAHVKKTSAVITIKVKDPVDTDGDLVPDSVEVREGTSPNDAEEVNDQDKDGIPDYFEQISFNGGDGNGDGILDHTQKNIASTFDVVAGGSVTLVASGDCVDFARSVVKDESTYGLSSDGGSYPFGVHDFTLKCPNAGQSAVVEVFYDQVFDTSRAVFKKINPTTRETVPVPGAVITTVNVGGQMVTKVTYAITDGDTLTDEDGVANKIIIDPAGVFVSDPISAGGSVRTYCKNPDIENVATFIEEGMLKKVSFDIVMNQQSYYWEDLEQVKRDLVSIELGDSLIDSKNLSFSRSGNIVTVTSSLSTDVELPVQIELRAIGKLSPDNTCAEVYKGLLEEEEMSVSTKVANNDVRGVPFLLKEGIIVGGDDGNLRLKDRINRAEISKILSYARKNDLADEGTRSVTAFVDVPSRAWYSVYVQTLEEGQIIEGYKDGTFRPEKFVNRAELYKFMVTSLGLDYQQVTNDDWYKPYEQALIQSGFLEEDLERDFSWEVSREEVFELLAKILLKNA